MANKGITQHVWSALVYVSGLDLTTAQTTTIYSMYYIEPLARPTSVSQSVGPKVNSAKWPGKRVHTKRNPLFRRIAMPCYRSRPRVFTSFSFPAPGNLRFLPDQTTAQASGLVVVYIIHHRSIRCASTISPRLASHQHVR